jgi:hypothetical protein
MVSYALRMGTPLPQITPGPLLDRFLQFQHGFNITRHEADDDYGLPRVVTLKTLADEQYLLVSSCISPTSANRLFFIATSASAWRVRMAS